MLILPTGLFCNETAVYCMTAAPPKTAMGTSSFPELSPIKPLYWQIKCFRLIFPHEADIWEDVWGNPVTIPCTIDQGTKPRGGVDSDTKIM